MGPSIGWVDIPGQNILNVTSSQTFTVQPSTNLVLVNVPAGGVTIILPSSQVFAAGAGALPGLFANVPITIVDVGGFASTSNIIIQPNNVSETIMGLTQITITTNFGGFTLQPIPSQRTWNSISP